jgi:serine phosphatase RsbU (regulator of sigma subunit)/pSer/pThr/pTyr-binding forkhead associated (FHA) protein
MPELIVKNSSQNEKFELARLRTTLGRSARSDICVPDPFASRIHAEVRKEGDQYWLQDLGSANGTRYNGIQVSAPVPLVSGGEVQIGETVLVFQDAKPQISRSATIIADTAEALNPAVTIALTPQKRATAEILESLSDTKSRATESKQGNLLALISKVGVALLGSNRLPDTLQMLASLVFEAVPADRCMIMLREDKISENGGAEENLRVAVARLRGQQAEPDDIHVSRTILDEVLKRGKSVLTSDAQHDPRFATQTMALSGIRSVLAVPLAVNENDVFGLIYADSPTYEATFTEEHLQILTTLGSVAAIRVENARLLEESFERSRMEHELTLAMEIQQNLQPSAPPQIEGYEFQGISFSCYEIGGDYYDFIRTHDGKMLIALGDVSGKGTAAALMMSSLHAAIHAQIASHASLPETINAVNQYLAINTPSNRFVTLFMGELDTDTGTLNFINAGHNPPLIVQADGQAEELASGGLPLGILPVVDYEVRQIQMEPGSVLVVYSDGVSETVNLAGEEFGSERLEQVVKNNLQRSAAGLRDRVESALSDFSQTAPAGDDITLVIVKRK